MTDTLSAPAVDVQGALSDMLRAVLLFVPKALLFVAILVIGWLVARVLRKVVDGLLERVGFDRWVERGGIRAALARSKYDASDIVAKLVYYAILLFTLQLAFGVWGPNPVSDLISGVVAWLPQALIAIIIIVVAAAIASWVKDLIGGALGGLSYGRLLANLASYFILGLGIIAALNQVGVATTVTTPVLIAVLATIAGILIVGVGGGLVRPMQSRWEAWLERAATESQTIAEQAKAYAAGREDMERAQAPQAAEPAQPAYATTGPSEGWPTASIPAATGPAPEATPPPATPPPAAPRPMPVSEQPTQVIPTRVDPPAER
jgi:hypothetical protein